jgi:hypothetical protein
MVQIFLLDMTTVVLLLRFCAFFRCLEEIPMSKGLNLCYVSSTSSMTLSPRLRVYENDIPLELLGTLTLPNISLAFTLLVAMASCVESTTPPELILRILEGFCDFCAPAELLHTQSAIHPEL